MPLTIGAVAKAAHVNIETIRYYERRGLFPSAPRTSSGYRQYTDDSIRRIRFIKRAQHLGFSLREIEELLALRLKRRTACDAVARKTREKLTVVDKKLEALTALKRSLQRLAQACDTRAPTDDCPVLEALEDTVAATSRSPEPPVSHDVD